MKNVLSKLEQGLYDLLVDELTRNSLASLDTERLAASQSPVDDADLPDRVGNLIGSWTARALAAVSRNNRPAAAIELSEAAIRAIDNVAPDLFEGQNRLEEPIERLDAIEQLAPTGKPISIRRPITPLRETVLMTNSPDQPGVGREITAESESASRIDVVMAFIRWTGIRDMLNRSGGTYRPANPCELSRRPIPGLRKSARSRRSPNSEPN